MPRFRRLRPSEPARVLETDASLAVQRGLALIAQRPRTDADLRDRLADRFDEAAVEAAVARLAELGYVDDAAWAAGYVARTRSTERSARMLRTELREHGVEAETAAEALLVHDDDAAALAAAQGRPPPRRGAGRGPAGPARRTRATGDSTLPWPAAGSPGTPSSGRCRGSRKRLRPRGRESPDGNRCSSGHRRPPGRRVACARRTVLRSERTTGSTTLGRRHTMT